MVLDPGEQIEVRVRGVSASGVPSAWGEPVTYTVPEAEGCGCASADAETGVAIGGLAAALLAGARRRLRLLNDR